MTCKYRNDNTPDKTFQKHDLRLNTGSGGNIPKCNLYAMKKYLH